MESVPDQRAVWEAIADSFDRSRERTWRHVTDFLTRLPSKQRVLDLMCGNGRHAAPAQAAGHEVVCFDWSRGLVSAANQRYGGGTIGDATALPFRSGAFDACVYVAGWHGLPTAHQRAASLSELHRVMRPGGLAQVTVWSRDAPRFAEQGVSGEPFDTVIPWRSDGHQMERTYHLTTLAQFVAECQAAGFSIEAAEEVAIVSDAPDNLVVELRR